MIRIFNKSIRTGRVTSGYPFEPSPAPPGFRGKPIWDEEKCNRCGVCAGLCPTGAVTAEKASGGKIVPLCDAPETGRGSMEAHGVVEMPQLRLEKCIFCGLCEEKCPAGAVILTGEYELAMVKQAEGDLKEKVRRIFGRSVHVRHLDTGSCNACDWEMVALTGPVYDVQRLGFDFVASPRHADMLMVTGPVTRNLEIAALKTFAAAPDPKLVVAVGACASSGGICAPGYAHHSGADNVLPVDVYIPGCPPRPQALIHGLMLAVEKMADRKR